MRRHERLGSPGAVVHSKRTAARQALFTGASVEVRRRHTDRRLLTWAAIGGGEEGGEDVHRQREDDCRVLLGGDGV